jgi:2,4-dienoyl-CoA reductase-like NADH-dependent reductase (Old Yellow Enzyme family)
VVLIEASVFGRPAATFESWRDRRRLVKSITRDQFINSSTNRRTDAYGGPIENRMRLLIEVVEAVSEIWGPDRVGIRLSPLGTFNDMGDDEPEATFSTIAKTLGDHSLAYLHIINPAIVGAMWMGGNVPLGYDVKDRKLI